MGAVGIEFQLCRSGAGSLGARHREQREVVSTPNDSNERLALYQQLFANGSAEIDVFQIDVVWPGILAKHLIDLRPYAKDAEREHLPFLIENNTVDGELKALPWFLDLGLLYYRSDLLKAHGAQPPRTWEELTQTAARIQEAERNAGNAQLWGYVWQGRAYEGPTCNALEWIAAMAAVGSSTKAAPRHRSQSQGRRRARSGGGLGGKHHAARRARLFRGGPRGLFSLGNAVFTRDSPMPGRAQSGDRPVRGKVGIAPLPASKEATPALALGGWQLAVSRYSRIRRRRPAGALIDERGRTKAARDRRLSSSDAAGALS